MIKFVTKNIKPLIPNFIFNFFRKIFTAILTPLFFSIDTGHFKSSLKSLAVDKNSKPICWFTYPALDFLDTFDLKKLNILEFGSGQSTLWWQKNSSRVISFENDKSWFEHIKKNIKSNNLVSLIENNKLNNSQIDLIKNFNFDILVIDGGFDRFDSLNLSLPYLSESGIVIIDNSEGYYDGNGINEYGYFPMLKLMKSKNFKRIDFFGYAPGVIIPHTTSIFFRNSSFIFNQNNYPKISSRSLYYNDRKTKNLI